jgi:hypothetical protein
VPEPLSSASVPPQSYSFNDEPSLDLESAAGASPEASSGAPNACLPLDAPAEAAVCSASTKLVQNFIRKDTALLEAASPRSSPSPTVPPVLSVSRDQINLQTGIPRIEAITALGRAQLTVGIDVLNVSGHFGVRNEDGSHGANVGLGANLLGAEVNIDYQGWSLTVGVAASIGGSVSSGEGRDVDADGLAERCFKMSLGPLTLGECDEL